MRLVHLGVAVAAYLALLLQVQLLGAWPLVGAQPHLIALGASVFLIGGRHDLGVIWMLVGGGLFDLLMPARFGLTLLPLFLAYGGLVIVADQFFEAPSWPGMLVTGTLLLIAAELPLTVSEGMWLQLVLDTLVGGVVLIPVAWFVIRRLELRRRGLAVR